MYMCVCTYLNSSMTAGYSKYSRLTVRVYGHVNMCMYWNVLM